MNVGKRNRVVASISLNQAQACVGIDHGILRADL